MLHGSQTKISARGGWHGQLPATTKAVMGSMMEMRRAVGDGIYASWLREFQKPPRGVRRPVVGLSP